MNLDSLYRNVSEAIHRAEQFEDMKAPARFMEYSNVSILEERIAMLLPASESEGAIARRGAVRAAMNAHDFQRAKELAARFSAEVDADASLRDDLRKLRNRAQAMALRVRRATPPGSAIAGRAVAPGGGD